MITELMANLLFHTQSATEWDSSKQKQPAPHKSSFSLYPYCLSRLRALANSSLVNSSCHVESSATIASTVKSRRPRSALNAKFDQLAELRNRIRHSRAVSEVVRKDGEAAIIWFRQVLS